MRTAAESDEEYGEEEYMNEEDWFEAHAEGANHLGPCIGKGCTSFHCSSDSHLRKAFRTFYSCCPNRPSWYLAFVLKLMLAYCAFTGDAFPCCAGTVANAAIELEGITLEFFSASKDASLH